MGYVAGGLLAGIAADAIGYSGAIAIVAALTAASGLWVLRRHARQGPSGADATVPSPAGKLIGGQNWESGAHPTTATSGATASQSSPPA